MFFTFIGNDPADDEVDIGGNEPPVSSYPPVEIEKDVGHRSNTCNSPGRSSGSTGWYSYFLLFCHFIVKYNF